MNEVLHANIFFVIASVATVVFCILVSIALYQVIKILRAVRRIAERVEVESERLADDVAYLRDMIGDGSWFSRMIAFVMGMRQSGSGRRRTRTYSEED
jgi:uncharacterized membrane protein YcjF (UPF0283 family)